MVFAPGMSVQSVFAEPVFNMPGDHVVVHLLEHEVAVAGDALIRQVHHGAVAAVGVIGLGKCCLLYTSRCV